MLSDNQITHRPHRPSTSTHKISKFNPNSVHKTVLPSQDVSSTKSNLLISVLTKKKRKLMRNLAKSNFPVPTRKFSREFLTDTGSEDSLSRASSPFVDYNSDENTIFPEEKLERKSSFFSRIDSFELASNNVCFDSTSFIADRISKLGSPKENIFKKSQSFHFTETPKKVLRPSNSMEIFTPEIDEIQIADTIIAPIPEKKRFSLSMEGAKGMKAGLVVCTIATVQQEIGSKLSEEKKEQVSSDIRSMLEYFYKEEKMFKTSQAESIAGCILLLAASNSGVGKKEFLEALKPLKKSMFKNVKLIKKSTCYTTLKKAYRALLKPDENK